ncbi:hypothetical protein [Pyrococcus abyssi]|nr:hypothetical protein [Pyrococcus abyssi]
MRIEVISKDAMNELSRVLSKAGIMNRTREELDWVAEHKISLRRKLKELKSIKIGAVKDRASELESTLRFLIEKLKDGEITLDDIGDDPELIEALESLERGGYLKVEDNSIRLQKDVDSVEDIEVEVLIPVEEVADYLEELESLGAKVITEVFFVKRYYVEVMEVELEAIQKALEIAEEYADEEDILESSIAGISKSLLSKVILELVKDIRRKNELVEMLMNMEPIELEGDKGSLRIYFEEDVLEEILKELQTLGYLKVKGNRIWFY